MIKPVNFPEVTNANLNTALVADKLNEVIAYLNAKDAPVVPVVQADCLHENSYQMRPGLMKCKTCKLVYKV